MIEMLIEVYIIAVEPLGKMQFLCLPFRVRDVLIEYMRFLKSLIEQIKTHKR